MQHTPSPSRNAANQTAAPSVGQTVARADSTPAANQTAEHVNTNQANPHAAATSVSHAVAHAAATSVSHAVAHATTHAGTSQPTTHATTHAAAHAIATPTASQAATHAAASQTAPHPHERLITVEEHFMSARVNEAFKQITGRHGQTPAERAKAQFIDAFVAKGEICEVGAHRLARMDKAGVDAQVLSYGNNSPMYLPAADAVDLCRQANDDLARLCHTAPERFYGLATLPVADAHAAADELTRCVEELGFKGVLLNGTFEGHFFDEERFFPIFERAAALGVPVQFHPGEVDAAVADHYYAGSWPAQVRTVLAGHGIGWHYDSGVQYLRFILSGALDRLSGLTLVCGHWGELLPYYLDRLNDTLPPTVTGLERTIKDYFRDNLYVTPSGIFYEAPFKLCLDVLGADRIMWASDYPYRPIDGTRDYLETFPLAPEDRALIAHGNAERVFGL